MLRAGFAVCGLIGFFADAAEVIEPQVLQASAGWHDLSLGPVDFLDWGFQTRGWNGGIPGPTFRMKPGEKLQINFTNDLNPAVNSPCSTGRNFCESETTNLHTHGLHISSKSKYDGLPHNSDDIFVVVEPGESTTYELQISENHAPGMHWYHPHHHHATALQAAGGAVGIMIVDDPVNYLPAEYTAMAEHILMISFHDLPALQEYARASETGGNQVLVRDAADKATAGNHPTVVWLVNGQQSPQVKIQAGQWHRLRMLFAAIEKVWELEITGTPLSGGTVNCDLRLLAKDGIYLDEMPRTISSAYLFPGARADVAIRCTCASYPCEQPASAEDENGRVFTFLIQEKSEPAAADLPSYRPVKPCYLADLQVANVPAGNVGTVSMDEDTGVQWNGAGQSMTWDNVHANGNNMRDFPPITTLTTGNIYEFEIDGADEHPLHIHINPYQITWMEVDDDSYFKVGDWHDTFQRQELTRNMKIRTQTDVFTGKKVVHCHLLEHEDEGLMGFFNVDGTEGATFTCAESLDMKCYRGAFADAASEAGNRTRDDACFGASSTPPAANFPWALVIGISVGVLLLILGGVAVYFLYIRKPEQQDQEGEGMELAEGRSTE